MSEPISLPQYRVIADSVIRNIERGTYPVGSQIPKIAELAKQYGVADRTAAKALKFVQNETGMIRSERGKRTIVLESRQVTALPITGHRADKTAYPKYRQIADEIQQDIIDGKILPGAPLPSAPKVAEQYEVSLGTVNRAYVDLFQRDGLVRPVPGIGTFVLDNPSFGKPQGIHQELIDLVKDLDAIKSKVESVLRSLP